MKINIYLIDDHRILREGIAALIAKQPGMVVVGDAADGHEGLIGIAKTNPDIVVLDISMPNLNGIEVTRRLQKEHPHIKILILSMHDDRRFVSGALAAGASGYLLKETASEELIRAIQMIADGHTYLSPAISDVLVQEFRESGAAPYASPNNTLTPRERESLQLFAEGLTAKEVSVKLGISTKTAETHRANLMAKLNLTSAAELTKHALREGIISL